jgi:hypothetical protein
MKKSASVYPALIIPCCVVLLLFVSGCANHEPVTECLKGHTYGFWGGLWHGIIAPIDLIAMIWRDDVSVYATNNNGIWYAFGFVLGSGGWGFLGGHGASRSGRKG